MSAPDWSSHSVSYGGTGWKPDMVRFFPRPDGKPREVEVTIVCLMWHHHVSLRPESNPVWDGKTWRNFSDDPEGKEERIVFDRFDQKRKDRALRWAIRTIERRFPAPLWAARWPDEETPTVEPNEAEDAAVEHCPTCDKAKCNHTSDELASCLDIDAGGEGIVGEPATEIRTLHDAGPVYGTVGEEIAVMSDMHPRNVVLLRGKRALITAYGGATNHLAQIARERGITVMLAPEAPRRYRAGAELSIDPAAGTITETPAAPRRRRSPPKERRRVHRGD